MKSIRSNYWGETTSGVSSVNLMGGCSLSSWQVPRGASNHCTPHFPLSKPKEHHFIHGAKPLTIATIHLLSPLPHCLPSFPPTCMQIGGGSRKVTREKHLLSLSVTPYIKTTTETWDPKRGRQHHISTLVRSPTLTLDWSWPQDTAEGVWIGVHFCLLDFFHSFVI